MPNDTNEECFHFNHWKQFETLSATLYVPLLSINILTLFPAAVLNFAICLTIYKTPSLSSVPSMIIIGNMALSDLSVAIVAQPIYIAWTTIEYTRLDHFYCASSVAFGVSSTLFAGVSLLTVTISSIDRFLALKLHLRYNSVVTSKAALLTCAALWIFALLIACSWIMFDFLTFSYFVVISMSLCIPATLVFYGVIFKNLRRHQRQIVAQERSQTTENNTEHYRSRLQRFRKTLIGTIVVYAAFLICYLPTFIMILLYSFQRTATHKTVLGIKVAVSMAFSNSAINPVLFLWRVSDLRQACKITMSKCFSRS